jgi:uncharacterized membrane protein SpoIIM required for sporulation
MDLATFLQHRRPHWRRLEELLDQVEGSGLSSLDDDQAVELGRLYRRAASDLNQAQTFVSGESTERYLNDLVARAYLAIYGTTPIRLRGILTYLLWDYPAIFRRNAGYFLLATVLFAAGTAFGYLASMYDSEVARAFLLPSEFPTIEPGNDNQEGGQLMTEDELAEFSTYLFTHNSAVTIVAFALGITLGLGSAWLMFTNGVTTGVLLGVFIEARQGLSFATGILPHGVLEIPAMLIGGTAGFVLARGVLRARPWPRRDELVRAGKEAILVLFGAAPLLACAGILEAGVARAPDWFLSKGVKLGVAGVFGLLFVSYLLLLGWGKRRPAEEAP